jgi:cytochrome c oxidase subunit 4
MDRPDAGGAGEAGAAAAAADTGHGPPRYMAVWGGLALLTLLEVGVAFMGFSRSVTILALLGMAVWKALLVALYYMHLRFEPNAVRLVAAAPLIPAAILMLTVLLEY